MAQFGKPFPVLPVGNRVVARTYDMSNGKMLTEREYDFRDGTARDLLQRHVVHCINNGKGVQIVNVKDDKHA